MKGILTLLVSLLLMIGLPGASSDAGPAPVIAVYFVADPVTSGDTVVAWTPPEMSDAELPFVTYEIYGYMAGEGDILLASVDATFFAATVPAGYDGYGVAVRAEGSVSAIVYGCGVYMTSSFPYLGQNCT